ncbi:hypothetical protein [Streptomyces puniciscabiei]|uniref:hypothetical protein n=1 Tax=Streptomyces puniciscabiei TaxID=164348 RepID=UPI0006EB71ED|nr:hypothetical protein [Streptomyces puniciscabiei]
MTAPVGPSDVPGRSKWADPRLCAATADRPTFNANLSETRTKPYRLTRTVLPGVENGHEGGVHDAEER